MGGKTSTEQTGLQRTNTKQFGTTSGSGTSDVSGATTGTATQAVSLPDYLQKLIQGVPGLSMQALQDLGATTGEYDVQPSVDALTATLGGDYLYGGRGFNQAVDAAVRHAMPGISSVFGQARRGGSGLYNAAIGQAAIDEFASLFGDERNRMMSAATALPTIQGMPLGMLQQLLSSTSGLVGQFAPLFGQTGTTAGTTEQSGTTTQKGTSFTKGKGVTQTFEPVQQPGILDYAIPALGMAASFAMPGLSGVSAGGNILSGLGSSGGLLGLFR